MVYTEKYEVSRGIREAQFVQMKAYLAKKVELIGMICPRICIIEAGLYDKGKPLEPGRAAVRKGASYYEGLGLGENLKYSEFPGGHEFHLDDSLAFLHQKIRKWEDL